MEIRGIGSAGEFNVPRAGAKVDISKDPKDSFVKSSTDDASFKKTDLSGMVLKKVFSNKIKVPKIQEVGRTGEDKKFLMIDIELNTGNPEQRFTGNVVPAEDGKFYAVAVEDEKKAPGQGLPAHTYSLVKFNESGEVEHQIPFLKNPSFTKVNLFGAGDGNVAVAFKSTISLFSKDGQKMWDCKKNFGFDPGVEFAPDGTTYVLDKYGNRDNVLKAISPDGTEKWSHEVPYGKMAVDKNGSLCLADLSCNSRFFDPDGKSEPPISITDERLLTETVPIDNDKFGFITQCPNIRTGDRIYIYENGQEKASWRPAMGQKMADTAYNEKEESFYVVTSEPVKMTDPPTTKKMTDHLTAVGIDGKTKWEIDLPSKMDSSAKHKVGADKDGNIYISIRSLSDNSVIPDSYKSAFPSAPPDAFDMTNVRSLMTCLSPDGKIQWQHKILHKNVDDSAELIPTREGNMLVPQVANRKVNIISADSEKYMNLGKEKIQEAIEEASKEMAENQAGDNREINVDEKKKTVNIGGVELPIHGPM